MDGTINLNLHVMLRYSELILEPGVKKVPLNDWLESYNIAKDGQLKHILRRCIPHIDSPDLSNTVTNIVKTDCVYERCDLLIQLLTHSNPDKEIISEWLTDQIISEKTSRPCPFHCVCSMMKLGVELIRKGVAWPTNLSSKLLKRVNNQRCALNGCLDVIGASIEANIESYYYIEQLFTELVGRVKPTEYLSLNGTIDDQPEVVFNKISDILILRKFVLNHLMVLTRLDLNLFLVDGVESMLMQLEELVSKSIHWSHHPLIDFYLENDSMLLKCLYVLVELHGYIIRNELAAHEMVQLFIDSINHDTGVVVDWLSSDSEAADLTLRFLLLYFKLPHHKTKCTPLGKIFFMQLLTKIESLWKNNLFPYDPSALLKYRHKFEKTPQLND